MCIGVPGKIVAVGEEIHQLDWVEVSGGKREINMEVIGEDTPGA